MIYLVQSARKQQLEYVYMLTTKNKKYCTRCDKSVPISKFGVDNSKKDKLNLYCKPCNRKATRERYTKQPPPKLSYSERKNLHLQRCYGITLGEYNSIFERQNGVCAICLKPETMKLRGSVIALAVDHCHTTGFVRGLLCLKCNRGIGCLQEDVSILSSAINYLSLEPQNYS